MHILGGRSCVRHDLRAGKRTGAGETWTGRAGGSWTRQKGRTTLLLLLLNAAWKII